MTTPTRRPDRTRSFLKGAGLAAAAGTVAAPAIAQAAPEIRWRLTSSFPRPLDTIFGTAQTFAKYMAEATDNKFQIQVFAAGEIVGGLQAMDAVQNGSVECAHTPIYYYIGKEPALGIGTGLPFSLNARQQHSWWHFAGGKEIIDEVFARYNCVVHRLRQVRLPDGRLLPQGNQHASMTCNGLKFRIGGLGGQVLAKLGVVPQQIAAGDVYPALERGTIDAAEFVGPYDDEKLGSPKVAKYLLRARLVGGRRHAAPRRQPAEVERAAEELPGHPMQASEAANNWMLAKYDAVNGQALRRMVGAGAELRPFPRPSWKPRSRPPTSSMPSCRPRTRTSRRPTIPWSPTATTCCRGGSSTNTPSTPS